MQLAASPAMTRSAYSLAISRVRPDRSPGSQIVIACRRNGAFADTHFVYLGQFQTFREFY
jgi:hypothetical protein